MQQHDIYYSRVLVTVTNIQRTVSITLSVTKQYFKRYESTERRHFFMKTQMAKDARAVFLQTLVHFLIWYTMKPETCMNRICST